MLQKSLKILDKIGNKLSETINNMANREKIILQRIVNELYNAPQENRDGKHDLQDKARQHVENEKRDQHSGSNARENREQRP